MHLAVIPCSKRKVWDIYKFSRSPVPAKFAYIGTLTKMMINLCESYGVPYVILSGKYGFLLPDEFIEPYDQYLELTPEFIRMLRRQVREKGLDRYRSIVSFCLGYEYNLAVIKAFRGIAAEILCPLFRRTIFDYVKAAKMFFIRLFLES